jgi:hypothetical protein
MHLLAERFVFWVLCSVFSDGGSQDVSNINIYSATSPEGLARNGSALVLLLSLNDVFVTPFAVVNYFWPFIHQQDQSLVKSRRKKTMEVPTTTVIWLRASRQPTT